MPRIRCRKNIYFYALEVHLDLLDAFFSGCCWSDAAGLLTRKCVEAFWAEGLSGAFSLPSGPEFKNPPSPPSVSQSVSRGLCLSTAENIVWLLDIFNPISANSNKYCNGQESQKRIRRFRFDGWPGLGGESPLGHLGKVVEYSKEVP